MLIDELLPSFDIRARYAITIRGSAGRIFRSIRKADLSDSRSVRALLALRGLPESALRLDGLIGLGFVELGEIPSQELVLGIVGQFWRPSGSLNRVPADQFGSFRQNGYNKAAWNFSIQAIDAGSCELATETRIESYGWRATLLFRLYWFLIAPFSGIIRREILKAIKDQAETEAINESA